MDYLSIGLTIFSLLLFLFLIFRKLRHDYPQDEIVRASIIGLIIGVIFWFLGGKIGLISPLSFVVSLLIVVWYFSKFRSWRFWASLEAMTMPGLVSLAIVSFNKMEAIGYILALVSNLFWRNYRRFHWYPSGRAGFLFLINLIVFSLFSLVLDFWQGRLLELTVWPLVLLISLISLVLISGRKKELKVEEVK